MVKARDKGPIIKYLFSIDKSARVQFSNKNNEGLDMREDNEKFLHGMWK